MLSTYQTPEGDSPPSAETLQITVGETHGDDPPTNISPERAKERKVYARAVIRKYSRKDIQPLIGAVELVGRLTVGYRGCVKMQQVFALKKC